MYKVITEHSTYVFNTNNRRFIRIPDISPMRLPRDEEWTPYIKVARAEIGRPLVIEWSLNGKRKYRTTTPVVDIDLMEG
jgi:hypothetical protein